MSAFLGVRSIAGVEAVEGSCYRRTVRILSDGKEHTGWIAVAMSPRKPTLRVAVSASLARALPPVLSRVKALMDLACHPAEVAQALGTLAKRHPGLRVPGAFDGFEIAVRAILGQQVTVAAARTVAGRFAATFGDAIATPFDLLTTLFPTAMRVAALSPGRIARLGMPGARARTVVALARAVADGRLVLMPNADIEATLDAAARAAGCRGMDRAIHSDAGALLAGRVSAHGSGRNESARRDRCAPSAGRGRSLAALARVRRDASMAIVD